MAFSEQQIKRGLASPVLDSYPAQVVIPSFEVYHIWDWSFEKQVFIARNCGAKQCTICNPK